jgi:hypothetical protein
MTSYGTEPIDEYSWQKIWSEFPGDSSLEWVGSTVCREYSHWDEGSTFCGVVKLHDGTYASFEAWTDYTGWGCQDGVEWFTGQKTEKAAAMWLTVVSRVDQLKYDFPEDRD